MKNKYITKKQKRDIAISVFYHIRVHCLLLVRYNIVKCIKALDSSYMMLSKTEVITQLVRDIKYNLEQKHHYNSLYSITDTDVKDYAKEHNMKITVFPHWFD